MYKSMYVYIIYTCIFFQDALQAKIFSFTSARHNLRQAGGRLPGRHGRRPVIGVAVSDSTAIVRFGPCRRCEKALKRGGEFRRRGIQSTRSWRHFGFPHPNLTGLREEKVRYEKGIYSMKLQEKSPKTWRTLTYLQPRFAVPIPKLNSIHDAESLQFTITTWRQESLKQPIGYGASPLDFGHLILKKSEQPGIDSIHKNSKKRPYITSFKKSASNTRDKTSVCNSISSMGRIFQWGHSTAGD